jgi:hypothetical protein
MIQPANDMYAFHLPKAPYKRIRLLASFFIAASLLGAAVCAALGVLFWPTYIHRFTPYLKWQDALLATLWYSSFMLLGGSVILIRFLFALRAGRRHSMLNVCPDRSLTVRDLSPQNFRSIYSMVGAALSLFLAALLGLAPDILIGWTLHLPHPALVLLATAIAILLSLAGLALTLISASFIVVGIIGSVSFTRQLGGPHTYQLTDQTSLRIDSLILTITYPDRPETLFDLNLLAPFHQQRLLQLLHVYWPVVPQPSNLLLGQEIEAALQESFQHPALPV